MPSQSTTMDSTFPTDDNPLMRTTNQMHFQASTENRRRTNRPTSNTRTHNPQPQHFRTSQLPSGQFVNISLQIGTDGFGGVPVGSGNPRDFDPDFKPDSIFRESFKGAKQSAWQKGNVKRYGQNSQPWANSASASVGIVPTVNNNNLGETTRTNTTNHDAFSTGTAYTSRFSSTSSRRAPADVSPREKDEISNVVKGLATGAVESWIRSAPGFEGEVVKRMMRSVSASVTPKPGSIENLGETEPPKSKWGDSAVTAVV